MRSRRPEIFWLTLTVLLLALTVWWLPGAGSLNTDTYSVSFAGRRVLFQTMSRLDSSVRRSTEQLIPRPGFADRLLILGPARYPTADEWSRLHAAVCDGATLIFAASSRDPSVDAQPFRARVVSSFDLLPDLAGRAGDDKEADGDEAADSESAGRAEGRGASVQGGNSLDSDVKQSDSDGAPGTESGEREGRASQDLRRLFQADDRHARTEFVEEDTVWRSRAKLETDDPDWETLLSVDDEPQVVRRRFGRGTFVLVASDEIFSNGAMLQPQRAELAVRILEAGGLDFDATWFDETLNASGVPKVLGILFAPEFRPVSLQLLLILILFGWMGARRFGPPENRNRTGRRSMTEHAEAVGILYFRAEGGAHAVVQMREFLRHELRRCCGPSFRVDDPEAVARQTQTVESDVRTLFDTVDGIRRRDAPLNNATAARLLQELATLIHRSRRERDGEERF